MAHFPTNLQRLGFLIAVFTSEDQHEEDLEHHVLSCVFWQRAAVLFSSRPTFSIACFCCLQVSHQNQFQVGFGFTNPFSEQYSNVSVFPLCHLSLPWPLLCTLFIFEADQGILVHPLRPSVTFHDFFHFRMGSSWDWRRWSWKTIVKHQQSWKNPVRSTMEKKGQWAQSNRQQLLWTQSNFQDHPLLHHRNQGALSVSCSKNKGNWDLALRRIGVWLQVSLRKKRKRCLLECLIVYIIFFPPQYLDQWSKISVNW